MTAVETRGGLTIVDFLSEMLANVLVDDGRLAPDRAHLVATASLATAATRGQWHVDDHGVARQILQSSIFTASVGCRCGVGFALDWRRELLAPATLFTAVTSSELLEIGPDRGKLLAQLLESFFLRLGVCLPAAIVLFVVRGRDQSSAWITSSHRRRSPF